MSAADVVKALAVAAELTGTELSATALRVMASDLASFQEQSVFHALDRCRKELSGRLTLNAILDRLNDVDGRPSADEAWAMSLEAIDEAKTVVWTQEAQQAFALARPVLDLGDKVGARMAFRDAYDRIVRDNREAGITASWNASLGWDKDLRVVALKKAESAGLLPAPQVAALLPHLGAGVIGDAIFNGKALPAPKPGESIDIPVRVKKLLSDLETKKQRDEEKAEARAKAIRDAFEAKKREAAEKVASQIRKARAA